ncbi:MAG: DUF3306 domain-containing protein [Pararhodobacter sp.]
MSRESFTGRWARLRAEAKAKAAGGPSTGGPGGAHAGADAAMATPDQAPKPAPTPGTEGLANPPMAPPNDAPPLPDSDELAALPPIESLTEQSDLRPFLGPGVPASLRNAAMRRMWLLNPTIRDHADCAVDYAWDWNTPGGVPGSGGRLSAASAKRMLEALGAPQKAPAPSTTTPSATTPSTTTPSTTAPDLTAQPPIANRPPAPEDAAADTHAQPASSAMPPAPSPTGLPAKEAAKPGSGKAAPRPERPRHGSARPR